MFINKRILLPALLAATAMMAFGQEPGPEAAQELSAGKSDLSHHRYDDAAKHFKKAIKLEHESCSSCFVWLLRTQLGQGKLDDALKNGEQALKTAHSDRERAEASLYRGVIFSRMANGKADKLKAAEEAFRDAAAANPECTDCKFDLGFVLLKEGKDNDGVAVLQAVLPEYKNEPKQREIQRFIADPSRARKDFAPEFSARLSNGQEVSLDTLRGKVVLLDFWGAWCPPCRESVPTLREISGKADASKVIVISIDEGDSKEKWSQFVQKNGMTWGQIYDEDHSLVDIFAVNTFPHYFLLNKDGIIVHKFSGWSHGELAILNKAIESALKE